MTSPTDRQKALQILDEGIEGGARASELVADRPTSLSADSITVTRNLLRPWMSTSWALKAMPEAKAGLAASTTASRSSDGTACTCS
ncbi:hypothetical protein [Cyanobium sp. ATX 6E8]|uniref:hypothetical protein n=1 Tax=Cyanobium sp. ATX 6E8 TaxID=2823701 RepID=UPI0020CBDF5D|nr:hypothetical protein [Cyanobium sp. ATX 6E8]